MYENQERVYTDLEMLNEFWETSSFHTAGGVPSALFSPKNNTISANILFGTDILLAVLQTPPKLYSNALLLGVIHVKYPISRVPLCTKHYNFRWK